MSGNASFQQGESSKRKADATEGTSRDGKKVKVKPQAVPIPTDEEDEWTRFQQEVLLASPTEEQDTETTISHTRSAIATVPPTIYTNATIEVQPELRKPPPNGDSIDESDEAKETEAQKKRRLAREVNEEIFARLEEEQRLQDEAEERVSSLKARLERIKAARATRTTGPKTVGESKQESVGAEKVGM